MPFQQAAVQWFFRMHIHVGHMPSYQQLCLTLKGVLAGCPPPPTAGIASLRGCLLRAQERPWRKALGSAHSLAQQPGSSRNIHWPHFENSPGGPSARFEDPSPSISSLKQLKGSVSL